MKKIITLFLLSFTFLSLVAQENEPPSLKYIIDSVNSKGLSNNKKVELLEKYIPTSENEELLMQASMLLADIYTDLELYEKAYLFYTKSLELALKKDKNLIIAKNYKSIGSVQLRIGSYKKSLENLKKAHEYFLKIGDKEQTTVSVINIAMLQTIIGPAENAIETLQNELNKNNLSSVIRSKTLMILGNVYLTNLNNPIKALTYYNEALSLLDEVDDRNFKVALYINLSESYLDLKQYDLALKYNALSGEILIQEPNLEYQTNVYRLYGNLFKKKKDYKKAMINYELYHKLKDSLDKKSTQLKIENINNKSEIKLKEQEIELQNGEIETLQKEETINNLKLIILTLFLLLLIISIFNLVKKSKEKINALKIKESKIKNKLNITKNDSERLAVNLISTQDFVETFADKIKNTLPYIKDVKAKEQVNNVFKEIKSYSMIHNTKKDIRDYTNKVSSDYKLTLRTKYPSLNEREQQICYLVYLNLKNSEIANLLNLSIRSVENKRYTIRKKMKLESAQSLVKYLNSL